MPCRWAFLSIWAPLANLEGVLLQGLLREKAYIWVPSLDPEVINILSGDQGSNDPIWGTNGLSIKA